MAIGIQQMGRVHFAGLGLDFNANLTPDPTAEVATYTAQTVLNAASPVDVRGVPTVGGVVASWIGPVVMGAGGLYLAHKGWGKTGGALVILAALGVAFGASSVTQAYATKTPIAGV